jgi:hypothetical protein
LTVLNLSERYNHFINLEDCPLTLENIKYGYQNIDLNVMRKASSPIIRNLI